jgi:hypothetical protein
MTSRLLISLPSKFARESITKFQSKNKKGQVAKINIFNPILFSSGRNIFLDCDKQFFKSGLTPHPSLCTSIYPATHPPAKFSSAVHQKFSI